MDFCKKERISYNCCNRECGQLTRRRHGSWYDGNLRTEWKILLDTLSPKNLTVNTVSFSLNSMSRCTSIIYSLRPRLGSSLRFRIHKRWCGERLSVLDFRWIKERKVRQWELSRNRDEWTFEKEGILKLLFYIPVNKKLRFIKRTVTVSSSEPQVFDTILVTWIVVLSSNS